MDAKPIPAFYCCYLLRSTVRHASVYVGSTPLPTRRLKQHNGEARGGAVKTSRLSLRPWEMTCIVMGFKSQIAALQFEWAWQNAHLTRHIDPAERISFATTRIKTSKSGKTRKKPGRPRSSLKEKLANLHVLLRSTYFSKWPLQVRFFNYDTFNTWEKCCKESTGAVREGIDISLDLKLVEGEEDGPSSPQKRRKIEDDFGKGGIEGLVTSYLPVRAALEKSQFLVAEGEELQCSVCEDSMSWDKDLIVTCPSGDCHALSHVSCLSRHFLENKDPSILIPDIGKCPSCEASLKWSDLMTEMTVRLRAPKVTEKVLKKRNGERMKTTAVEAEEEGDEEDAGLTADEVAKFGENWEDGVESDDVASVTSITMSEASVTLISPPKKKSRKKKLPSVIEESDWENAETIM